MYSLVVGESSLRARVVMGIRRGVAITGERMARKRERMKVAEKRDMTVYIQELEVRGEREVECTEDDEEERCSYQSSYTRGRQVGKTPHTYYLTSTETVETYQLRYDYALSPCFTVTPRIIPQPPSGGRGESDLVNYCLFRSSQIVGTREYNTPC